MASNRNTRNLFGAMRVIHAMRCILRSVFPVHTAVADFGVYSHVLRAHPKGTRLALSTMSMSKRAPISNTRTLSSTVLGPSLSRKDDGRFLVSRFTHYDILWCKISSQ